MFSLGWSAREWSLGENQKGNLLESSMMDPCSVGVQLRTTNECHKTYYTRHTGFKTLQELSSNDMLLLQLRTGMTLSGNNTICFHHAKVYIDRFEDLQKSCCDPFNIHKKLAKKNLHVIDLDDATFLSAKFGRQLVPGWKLCPKCTQIINGSVDVDSEDRQKRKPDSDVCRVNFFSRYFYSAGFYLIIKKSFISVHYSWPLNSTGLNSAGPLICGLLSVSTVLLQSVLGWIQRRRGPTLGLEQQPSILVSRTDSGTSCTRISRGGLECSEYEVEEVKIDDVF